MGELESLSHTKWECKYHVVFVPKCRRKALYDQLRPHLGEVLKKLVMQKESRIEEEHMMADHVHMLICDSAEVCSISGDTLYQREKRDLLGTGIW
jgi:putative transposase